MDEKKDKFTADTWIAIVATLCAIIAILISVWDHYEIRKHNRLSVMPLLRFNLEIAQEPDGEYVGLYLTNNGFGPAVVTRYIVRLDDKEIEKEDLKGEIQAHIGPHSEYKYAGCIRCSPIKESEKILIFGLPNQTIICSASERLLDFLSRLEIDIVYESIYHDTLDIFFKGGSL